VRFALPPVDLDGPPPLLRMRALWHRYGDVPTLKGIFLDVRAGEVLAIVGENGAGKSTLLRIMGGIERPCSGKLEIQDGAGGMRDADFRGVRDAERAGIALVHQELNLAENLDVAGNIFLGREPSRFGFLDRARMHAEARTWLATVGLHVDPATPCGTLPIAHRQLVEIAKALSAKAKVLVLDEPTSSLSAREKDRLLAILRELRDRGTAVVFVSHHLDEVMRVADRVVVLRDGEKTGDMPRAGIDRATVERLMVGRYLETASARAPRTDAPIRLRADAVVTPHHRRRAASLQVRAGEIVGLAGLVGAGRTELLESIAGVVPHGGRVSVDGAELGGDVADRTRRGVALVPEDRVSLAWIGTGRRDAGAGRAGSPGDQPLLRRIDGAGERATVRRVIEQVQLRPDDPSRPVATLSGGNQQKTVLGRWIAIAPAVLLLDEPTRGVDVGARAEIHREVRRLADAGTAVLFASSELEEVLLLADRVLVMHDGGIAGELSVQEATEEAIMHLATGGAA
jgi:ribose transport system ATP-binding protein